MPRDTLTSLEKPVSYPVPWDLVFGLTNHIRRGTQRDLHDFTRQVVARMSPGPRYEGIEHLPESPRFVLVANHYQRKGLWILHTASAITQGVVQRYPTIADPPARWMVTANWPPIKLGKWTLASPGDVLLPRVANALHCYPVTFAGTNPAFTARTIRRILSEAANLQCPLGIFPEGVAGVAGEWHPPLPGVGRLITQLAKRGLPVVPAFVTESSGGLVVRFGAAVAAGDVLQASGDAAQMALDRVRELERIR